MIAYVIRLNECSDKSLGIRVVTRIIVSSLFFNGDGTFFMHFLIESSVSQTSKKEKENENERKASADQRARTSGNTTT